MEHLNLDALARLVDETPSPDERDHLAECDACATELEALRDQTSALGELADLRPPRGGWDTLEARLVSEGLIRSETRLDAIGRTPAWMRIAAAAVLFLGGAGVGIGVTHSPASQFLPERAGTGGASFAQASGATSVEEAAEVVQVAERQYIDALVRYRQLVDTRNGEDPVGEPEARFAALEYLVAASQVALQQAPADPFLNGLLASAIAERQAARQAWVRRTGQAQDWY